MTNLMIHVFFIGDNESIRIIEYYLLHFTNFVIFKPQKLSNTAKLILMYLITKIVNIIKLSSIFVNIGDGDGYFIFFPVLDFF